MMRIFLELLAKEHAAMFVLQITRKQSHYINLLNEWTLDADVAVTPNALPLKPP